MPTPSEMYDEGWHQGYTHALATTAALITHHVDALRKNYRSGNVDIAFINGVEWAETEVEMALEKAEADYDRSRSRARGEAVAGDAPVDPSHTRPGGLLAG